MEENTPTKVASAVQSDGVNEVNPVKTPEQQAADLGIPFVVALPHSFDKKLLKYIPEESAKTFRMFPYLLERGALYVALVDPQSIQTLNSLRFLAEKEGVEVQVALTTEEAFQEFLRQYQATDKVLSNAILSLKKDEQEGEIKEKKKEILQTMQDAPIAKLVETIVYHALDGRASDIHVEPIDATYRVRFRVDGILRAQLTFPLDVGRAVISRIKILSNLKIDEKRKPQDGRFRFESRGNFVDLRVSSLPVLDGEKIVMRVLEKGAQKVDSEALGLWGRNRRILTERIQEPYGIILMTGPTGSGKSTTLYSFLQMLNDEERNIITLEDPIEYFIEGINQSQIRPEIGYTFASGLRSILRQDPNVIMVGEIRDSETAELAIHAALTGHLVLSTLHTNGAVGSIPRLVDMGIQTFLLASSLRAVAAQRLVRRICENCKEPAHLTPLQKENLQKSFLAISSQERSDYGLAEVKEAETYQGKGCEECGDSGYKGRIAIYEALEVTPDIHEIIVDKNANEVLLIGAAAKQNMLSMKEDGILKVIKGITTLSEIERVTEGELIIEGE
jgi:type IV pilus assembly protein PilB